MPVPRLYRFEKQGRRIALDTESCFCFECDPIAWEVLSYFPQTPAEAMLHALEGRFPRRELEEVLNELEWLRSTRAILTPIRGEQFFERLKTEPGLEQGTLSLCLPEHESVAVDVPSLIERTLLFFLARSRVSDFCYEIIIAKDFYGADEIWHAVEKTFRLAEACKRRLTVQIVGEEPSGHPWKPHRVSLVRKATDADMLRQARASLIRNLSRPMPTGQASEAAEVGQWMLRFAVQQPKFAETVQQVWATGFRVIEVDLDDVYSAATDADLPVLFDELHTLLRRYRESLRKGLRLWVEPFASWFKRIYEGTPITRSDGAGQGSLFTDVRGRVYPNRAFAAAGKYCLGNVWDGSWDETAQKPFETVGAVLTPPCMACWARHICGGGYTTAHVRFSNMPNQPAAPWCDAQRRLIEDALAAFTELTALGIPFPSHAEEVWEQAPRGPRLSWREMFKAVLYARIGLRPLAESDAAILQKWENWNASACFSFAPEGVMLSTEYDWEMEALHPRENVRFFILHEGDERPIGVVRIEPHVLPGTLQLSLYVHPADLYRRRAFQRSIRGVLQQLTLSYAATGIRRLLIPAADHEEELKRFLAAVGLQPAGVLREALFLHGRYHDVQVFEWKLETAAPTNS